MKCNLEKMSHEEMLHVTCNYHYNLLGFMKKITLFDMSEFGAMLLLAFL